MMGLATRYEDQHLPWGIQYVEAEAGVIAEPSQTPI